MKQVWFCGMHSDVGGGYREQGLSDVPLLWMLSEAREHGLRIYQKHAVSTALDPNGTMHDSRDGRGGFYRKRVRTWDVEERGKPVVHESVLQRNVNRRNEPGTEYKPWISELEPDVEPWTENQREAGRFL